MDFDLRKSQERKAAERDWTEITILRWLDDVDAPGTGIEGGPLLVQFLTQAFQRLHHILG